MLIRPYQPEDLPRLQEITVEAFSGVSIDQAVEQKFGEINGHDWKWRKAQHIAADAKREPEGIFVVELEGKIVGCITTWHDAEQGIGYIPNIVFTPECRGKGMGRKLINHALHRFRQLGLSLAKIETLAHNEVGNHLYESIGFQEITRQIHFFMPLKDKMTEKDGINE